MWGGSHGDSASAKNESFGWTDVETPDAILRRFAKYRCFFEKKWRAAETAERFANVNFSRLSVEKKYFMI
jgi:hypothetical protein